MTLRGQLFEALTQLKGADVSGRPGGDIRGMLLAVGGRSSRTRSGIDLTKAAGVLQVSRRTVERWVRSAETGQGQRPSAEHAKTLSTKARQAATTQAGRRQAMEQSPMVERIRGSRSVNVRVEGFQGPAPTPLPGEKLDTSYMRNRTTTVELTDPADIQQMLDAYARGGDRGFREWVDQTWAFGTDNDPNAIYLSDWKFESIDKFTFEPLD